jgi:F-type H+-transporting ATPase subunit a
MIIAGLENFVVDITGEEGRWFSRSWRGVSLYFYLQPDRSDSQVFSAHGQLQHDPVVCHRCFLLYPLYRYKVHGAKYYKHFMGRSVAGAGNAALELISHFARVLSLSMRLFGNMSGHELVLAIFFGLRCIFCSFADHGHGVFVSFVQAFVFFMLSIMYFAGAMEHAH